MLSRSFFALALGLAAVDARPLRRDGAQQMTGRATIFHPDRATCGMSYSDNDAVAAVSRDFFDAFGDFASRPPDNPVCLYKVSFGNGADFTIADVCDDCAFGDVQLSPAAMSALGVRADAVDELTWHIGQSDVWPFPNDIPVAPLPLAYDVTLAPRPTAAGEDAPAVTTASVALPCGGAHDAPSEASCEALVTTLTATLYAPTATPTDSPSPATTGEPPVVTTIWGTTDCNANNAPGEPMRPCPPAPTSTVITLTPTPTTAIATDEPPIVTTIWGSTDCNANNAPGEPMKPCPPAPTSTVVTLTPTPPTTIQSTATATDEPPVVTTIWGSTDCNANNAPGEPMKPCPPAPTSTVVTLTPTETASTQSATTATGEPPVVTTIWGSTDCNANNEPGEPMKPCPPAPTSTVITLTPTPTTTIQSSSTATDEPPVVTTIWGSTDCNANNAPGEPMKPCPPAPTSTVVTVQPSATAPTEASACGAAAYDSSAAYSGGDVATYNGRSWRAQWWTQGAAPGNDSAWEDVGACSDAA